MTHATDARRGATLTVEHLTVRYGAHKALNDVSLDVSANEVVALIGTNGSGKTTLLNAISGLVAVESGRCLFGGRDLKSLSAPGRARLGIGRTFQHARLIDELSVISNVLLGARWCSRPSAIANEFIGLPRWRRRMADERVRALETLRRCGINGDVDGSPADLPFGQRKVVDLARALASEPSLLIMDEPTAGLSQDEVNALRELVLEVKRYTSVLVVAHHMGFVSKVADRVVCLEAGGLLAEGTPEAVQSHPDVIASYVGTPT